MSLTFPLLVELVDAIPFTKRLDGKRPLLPPLNPVKQPPPVANLIEPMPLPVFIRWLAEYKRNGYELAYRWSQW